MTRLNIFLLLAVLASALYLVGVQYESRRVFSELDKARSQERRLESENERLQVERRAQATPLRVEKLAKEQLQMRTVTPAITDYATANGASGVSGFSGVNAVNTVNGTQLTPAPVKTGATP